jgi:hypothetical protein
MILTIFLLAVIIEALILYSRTLPLVAREEFRDISYFQIVFSTLPVGVNHFDLGFSRAINRYNILDKNVVDVWRCKNKDELSLSYHN